MKLINTEDAVGHVLCQDLTQIIPGVVKDAIFRKGHVVTEEDIPVLLSIGKEHLYVWEKKEGILHEDEAAEILYGICKNTYMHPSDVKEGKIDVIADIDGVFQVDRQRLDQINALGEMMIATRHGNFPVKKGDKLAGTRIIPLIIEEEKMKRAQEVAGAEPLLKLLPYTSKQVSVITTGSEVYKGRIQDEFGPVIVSKLKEYGISVMRQTIVDDESVHITEAIQKDLADGAQMVICTGGMSVDPDDSTPGAIKATGANVVTYGAPVLPGAMFLLAYWNDSIPVLGLPGCVMYAKRTIFDLVLPRLLADEKLKLEDITTLGQGGLCLSCDNCTYPNCGFGK